MPDRNSRTSVNLDVTAGAQPVYGVPESDTPFRILVLGDFSGRANRGVLAALEGRRPRSVDCDNLDEILAGMGPALQLPQATLRFRKLDDFHPDQIYQSIDIFRKFAELRSRPAPIAAAAPQKAPPIVLPPGKSLLDSMVDEEEEEASRAERVAEQRDDLADFIKKAMAPHLEAREDPHKQQWAVRVDAAAGDQMRAVLHHPQFQALEAAWRGVQFLVDRLQPDLELKLYLFDATLEELMSDAGAIGKCLGEGKDPWALIIGAFAFGQTAEDAAKLHWLGRLAAALGAPFLGEALPPTETAPAPHWQELAGSPEAKWIGLAVPRFLLRLPYGKATSPVEGFAFEEMPESIHAAYLWGNPAFCCGLVIGRAFRSDGWQLRAGQHGQIETLPQHIYRADGESIAKPCAEVLLTEADADFLLERGFMPLASIKDQDSALLVRLQSIAVPLAPLSSRWA